MKIGQVLKDGSLYVGEHPVEEGMFLLCKAENELDFVKLLSEKNPNLEQGVINWIGPEPFRIPTCVEMWLINAYFRKLSLFCKAKTYDEQPYAATWLAERFVPDMVNQRFHANTMRNLIQQKRPVTVWFVRVVTQKELEEQS